MTKALSHAVTASGAAIHAPLGKPVTAADRAFLFYVLRTIAVGLHGPLGAITPVPYPRVRPTRRSSSERSKLWDKEPTHSELLLPTRHLGRAGTDDAYLLERRVHREPPLVSFTLNLPMSPDEKNSHRVTLDSVSK